MDVFDFFRGRLDWYMDQLGIPKVVTDDPVQYLYLTLAELETRAKSLYTDNLGAPLDVSYEADALATLGERHSVFFGKLQNKDVHETFWRAMDAWTQCWGTYQATHSGK